MNIKGFSMVQLIVAMAILSVISLGTMRLMQNSSDGQRQIKLKAAEGDLKVAVRMILDNQKFCKASLAGIEFYKRDIDGYNDQPQEGQHISLWYSDSAGDRSILKFIGTEDPNLTSVDKSKTQFESLIIKSIKLQMDNPTTPIGSNYDDGVTANDLGKIKIITEKRVGKNTREQVLNFDIDVSYETVSGKSKIISCSRGLKNGKKLFLNSDGLVTTDGNPETKSLTNSNCNCHYPACPSGWTEVSRSCRKGSRSGSCGGSKKRHATVNCRFDKEDLGFTINLGGAATP